MSTQDMRSQTEQRLAAATGLDELYPILNENRYTAGWHKKRRSLWPQPDTVFKPLHWRYAESKLALDQAGEWIGTDLAERRNLLMFNPVGDNDYSTVRTLVTAYQMVKPGEYARAHRHSPNALRLVLDTPPGLYTVVNGIQIPMIPGDVLLTPGNFWHSHFSEEGKAEGRNSYWIDFLDVPLVQLLEPMFYEEFPGGIQPVEQKPEKSDLWFPFGESKRKLAESETDARGVRHLALPSQTLMPTMQLLYRLVPAGGSTGQIHSTENRIFAVAEGEVTFKTPSLERTVARGDIFAVPGWTPFEIIANEAQASGAYVFEVSDLPVQQKLGYHRSA
jgi:gentisate 1,2-dioxygenase